MNALRRNAIVACNSMN